MHNQSIVLLITIIGVIVLSSGCINNNSANQQIVTPTVDVTAYGYFNNGFSAFIEGKYDTALDYYNKSIAADPKFVMAWNEKGKVLNKLNRTEEALAAYDAAIAIENNTPEFWNSRGETLMILGRYAEARDSFDKAIQLAPEYGKAKANRDLALAKLK